MHFWLMLFFGLSAGATPCDFSGHVFGKAKTGFSKEWEVSRQEASLQQAFATKDSRFKKMEEWIKEHSQLNAVDNLRRSLEIWIKGLTFIAPNDVGRAEISRGIRQIQAVLQVAPSLFQPMNCLQGIPFREFLSIVDLRRFPQEFTALYFEKGGRIKILGDFHFDPDGDGPGGTFAHDPAIKRQAELMAQGWKVFAHLHNHPFIFGGSDEDFGGTLVPSEADISNYISEKIPRAWITNGQESIEFGLDEILRLKDI